MFRSFQVLNPLHAANKGNFEMEQYSLCQAVLHHGMRQAPAEMARELVQQSVFFFQDTLINFFDKNCSDAEMMRFTGFLEVDSRKLPIRLRMKSIVKEFTHSWVDSIIKQPYGASVGTVTKAVRDLLIFSQKSSKEDLELVLASINKMVGQLIGNKYRFVQKFEGNRSTKKSLCEKVHEQFSSNVFVYFCEVMWNFLGNSVRCPFGRS